MGKRNREAFDSQVLEVHGTAHEEVKAGCRQRDRFVDGVLWGFWAKTRSVNSNQKQRGALVSFAGAL